MNKPQAQTQKLGSKTKGGDIIVIKVGGRFFNELFEQSALKHPLLHAIDSLILQGKQVVLVHGGGEQVQTQLTALGFKTVKANGLRVTPFEQMPIVAGVLSGYLNKTLVAHSAAIGINALGITLADGAIAKCRQISQELGAVGAPVANDPGLLKQLIEAGMLPIVASIGCDEKGLLYNVNADHAATCIAQLLNAKLYLLSDVKGVLDADGVKIDELSAEQAQTLIAKNVITDGMIVKVNAAQDAADVLDAPVTIGSWNDIEGLINPRKPFGTQIHPYSDSVS
ncbi:acetylglutamate kinase [Glaciecola sp. XM2]|jgi:acetylglutamate kinase|uniref:acetylglutamate kinase n=1 Tax=Glaciecola sp. XM2 TaxID=1914931 RepID=UPI001BDE34B0|nr:acetylglutamate kinase [Glaciecola sp. XM2]MBT1449827.1 acetylglutamate kinase [Glaciecola sp. XM2]